MEYEITDPVHLSAEQLDAIELHSVINVLSLLVSNLSRFDEECEDEAGLCSIFSSSLDICSCLSRSVLEKRFSFIDEVELLEASFEGEVDEIVTKIPDFVSDEFFSKSVENIFSLINCLKIRLAELADRADSKGQWTYRNIKDLEDLLKDFFYAVEKNSRGRYRVVFNPKMKASGDYLVDIDMSSVDGSIILLPVAFPDVLRDLLANARKYTPPGGLLRLNLRDDGDRIGCSVEDTGIGIPEAEIREIVKFGVRSTNVPAYQSQYGGGFGLTKALFLTRLVNGRMWIRSVLSKGTMVRIEIPRP